MVAVVAWIVAGVALWFSRSVLDVFDAAGQVTRVAIVPSMPELTGLVVLSMLAAAGVYALIDRWTVPVEQRRAAFVDVSLPLFGLIVLILPYLPAIPDEIQSLRAITGPAVGLVWAAVVGQVVATLLTLRQHYVGGRTAILNAATIAVVTLAVLAFAARRLDSTLAIVALIGMPSVTAATYHVSVRFIIGAAAITAVIVWRWVVAFTGSREGATLAWAAVFLGAPMLFTSVSIFPDVPAALCVAVALAWRSRPSEASRGWVDYLVRGLAVSALPWMSAVFMPGAVAVVLVLGLRATQQRALLALLVPFTVSMVRWLTIKHPVAFGNPLVGAAGLLFDQEFGVLAYAPALAFGLLGLGRMLRARDGMVRRQAIEIAAVFIVFLLSAGGVAQWWGSAAPPGRPLTAILPLLALPFGWAYAQASPGSCRRAAAHVLVLVGAAISLSLLLAEHGGLLLQDRDGSSRLLEWFSTLWPVWKAAPAIAGVGLRSSAALLGLWIFAAIGVAWVLARSSLTRPGRSALFTFVTMTGAVLVVWALCPMVVSVAPIANLEARARLPLLDNFDSRARPHAVIYRPFKIVPAVDVPSLMVMAPQPGLRAGSQPVRLLLNARYALAAGDYRVELSGLESRAPVHGTIGLQVGRTGPPLREWPVDLTAGSSWMTTFSLPVDAEFVGFVPSESLAGASSLRITPLRIVDKNNRDSSFHGPSRPVVAAVAFRNASIFFHDDAVYPERDGFWVKGQSTAFMTVSSEDAEQAVVLRAHAGALPNTLDFETATWGQRVALTSGQPADVQLPVPPRPGPFLLRVHAEQGFVPADKTPASGDHRFLGCWIEVVHE
jgi:hypothetical protein